MTLNVSVPSAGSKGEELLITRTWNVFWSGSPGANDSPPLVVS
jgi:hypothetical protein